MKLLYFGTACSSETFELLNKDSSIKASAAPQFFQNMLLKGLVESKQDIQIRTILPIGHYQVSKKLFIRKKSQVIFGDVYTEYLPAINLIGVKQVSYMINAAFELIKWNWKFRKQERVVIIYGMYLPVSLPIVLLSKLLSNSVITYVNDLPDLMLNYSKQFGLKAKLVPIYTGLSKYIYDKFDGYLCVSKQLNDVVNRKNKPTAIVEAFIDVDKNIDDVVTKNENAIMYAGTLHKNFGIDKLIYAFKQLEDPDLQLWIFGFGDMVNEIKKEIIIDNRIKFFGMRPWEEVFEYEKRATLLVNPRFSKDEYTKYSFPSKTMEYMLSGTPVLMTKLKGIENEYIDHVFITLDETIEGWKESLEKVMKLDKETLELKGKQAKQFIIDNKNLNVQTDKVINLINKVNGLK